MYKPFSGKGSINHLAKSYSEGEITGLSQRERQTIFCNNTIDLMDGQIYPDTNGEPYSFILGRQVENYFWPVKMS